METVNHECYVSLEVAKLLKEAGFDWEIKTFYFNNELGETMLGDAKNHNFSEQFISAPTIEVAQRWLREVKNFNIYVQKQSTADHHYFGEYYFQINESPSDFIPYETYEEAQEAGIKKTLELILEKEQ